jgi:uncharacterized OB-fold protein
MSDPVTPIVGEWNRPFWDAASAGELRFQRCVACGHLRYPIAPICPRCLDARATWDRVSGRGEVLSYVIFRRAYHPSRADQIPYAVALIQTDEGPRMFSDLPAGEEGDIAVGDRVEVEFIPSGPFAVPRFRRLSS